MGYGLAHHTTVAATYTNNSQKCSCCLPALQIRELLRSANQTTSVSADPIACSPMSE
jgi:hypothetical protein